MRLTTAVLGTLRRNVEDTEDLDCTELADKEEAIAETRNVAAKDIDGTEISTELEIPEPVVKMAAIEVDTEDWAEEPAETAEMAETMELNARAGEEMLETGNVDWETSSVELGRTELVVAAPISEVDTAKDRTGDEFAADVLKIVLEVTGTEDVAETDNGGDELDIADDR